MKKELDDEKDENVELRLVAAVVKRIVGVS